MGHVYSTASGKCFCEPLLNPFPMLVEPVCLLYTSLHCSSLQILIILIANCLYVFSMTSGTFIHWSLSLYPEKKERKKTQGWGGREVAEAIRVTSASEETWSQPGPHSVTHPYSGMTGCWAMAQRKAKKSAWEAEDIKPLSLFFLPFFFFKTMFY